MLRQREKRIKFRSTCADRYALRALVHAQGQQIGECWPCKAEPRAKFCRRRDVKSRRRLPPSAPMAAPHQDAMPYGRVRSSPDETASNRKLFTHHTKRVWMRRGTDHSANNVAVCSKPFKLQERCLNERQRGSRAFLCGNKPVTHKVQDDESERQTAQVLHVCFFFFEKDANTFSDVAQ